MPVHLTPALSPDAAEPAARVELHAAATPGWSAHSSIARPVAPSRTRDTGAVPAAAPSTA